MQEEWMQAVKEEIESLTENNIWELIVLPQGTNLMDNRWVFKIKRDKDVEKYKTKLIAKGCAQRKGYDYEETYASVARLTILRILLAVIIERDLYASHIYVKNTFLHLLRTWGGNIYESACRIWNKK